MRIGGAERKEEDARCLRWRCATMLRWLLQRWRRKLGLECDAVVLRTGAGAFCARRWTRLVDARVRCCHGEDGEAWWLRRDGAGSRRWWRREKEMVAPPLLREMRKMVVARRAAGREGCCCRWFCSCVFRRGGGGRRGWRRRLPWKVEGEEKIRVRVLGDEDDDVAAFHWTAC